MAAMMSASCVEEFIDTTIKEEKIEMVFSASCANDTKATLVNGTEVWWEPDDHIVINGDYFWPTISEPCRRAEFVGETMPADTYNAVYTSSHMLEFDGEDHYVYLTDQTAVINDIPLFKIAIDKRASPRVDKSSKVRSNSLPSLYPGHNTI